MRIYRGDIYIARLNSIGSEQSGDRPVLILQNDVGNCCGSTTIIAPITSRVNKKSFLPTHIPVSCRGLEKESVILLEQIRTIDKRRIKGKLLGHINKVTMLEVDKAIGISLNIDVKYSNENV